jgi:S-adenosylmethionine decarboxylase
MKTRFYKLFLFLVLLSGALISTGAVAKEEPEEFQFVGRHLIASYHGCDAKALEDIQKLPKVMEEAVNASGAHLLKSVEYVFEPNGLTMVLLLSESHASIHTYPEHNACFVDLFTCGHNCSAEKFDQALQDYLKPTKVNKEIITRQ